MKKVLLIATLAAIIGIVVGGVLDQYRVLLSCQHNSWAYILKYQVLCPTYMVDPVHEDSVMNRNNHD
jgi:hypothetical protein